MNQHVSISYEQTLKDAYKARQSRFNDAVRRQRERQRQRTVVVVINPIARKGFYAPKSAYLVTDRKPLWKTGKLYFSAHVVAYQRHTEQERPSVRRYVAKRAAELGFCFETVVSPKRNYQIAHARQLIMWELKRIVKTDISYPEIGRIFNRDHTTVIHAVRRVDEIKGWKPE